MKEKNKFLAGFTLTEILLVVSMIGIVAGISIPAMLSLQTKNYTEEGIYAIAQTLKRAEILSQGMDGDSSWGVKVQDGSIVLFKGVSYASRDADFDEIFELPLSVAVSGVSEIVFEKLTGNPQASGSIVLTANTGESRSLEINKQGMAEY